MKKLKNVKTPEKHLRAAAFDLFIPEGLKPFCLEAGDQATIDLGIAFELPKNYRAIIMSRSGYAAKDEVYAVNGLIDPDYRAGIKAIIRNYSNRSFYVCGGLKIC